MYQHKLEKDIRCPLEYGLKFLVVSGSQELFVCLQKKKIIVNENNKY